MKTSYTKRALAFWLAVAMLATGAPAAFAAEPGVTGTGESTPVSTQITPVSNELTSSDQTLNDLTVGTLYTSQNAIVSGGQSPYKMTAKSGTIPSWLSLTEDGKLTGTPTEVGTGNVTVTISDSTADAPLTKEITISYTVKAKEISVSAATVEDKTYDATTDATVKSVTFGSEQLDSDDYTATAKFTSADVSESAEATVTVELTEQGKGKYTLITSTAKAHAKIIQADLSKIDVPKQSFKKDTAVTDIESKLAAIQAEGIGSTAVSGTYDITKAEYTGDLPAARANTAVTADNFVNTVGAYRVTATFTPQNQNYKAQEVTFDCDITGQESQTLSFAKTSITATFGGTAEANTATSTAGSDSGKITYASTKTSVATVDKDTGSVTIVGAGTTTIKAHTDGSAQYLPADASYTLTVNPKNVSEAKIGEITQQTYTGSEIEPELTIADGQTKLEKGKDYDVAYTNNVFPGTATATVTFKGNYSGTATKTFTIRAGTYSNTSISQFVVAGQNAVLTIPVDLANAEITSYGTITVDGMNASIVDGTPTRNENAITAKIKSSATNNQTANIKIKLTTKGYGEVELTYILTVAGSKTQLTSSQINFASKTVTADGKTYFALENARLNGVQDTNGKWTYALQGISTYSTDDQGKMPQFKEPGRYTIVASYQGNSYVGSKTATLTIKPATTSIISLYDVSQISSSRDDNYRYFDVDMGTPRDNYVRVNVDADDDLDKQRVDGTSSEWIGLVLEPTKDGTKKTSGLYVSDDKKEWTSLRDDIRMGDFYIDDVDSTSFELWYDTDDRDCSKSLYLATDTNGSNLFEIDVDFDSYSGSSSSSSGSSSSDTSKKDGDRVSTTTIDKTPSVKSRSATVTFSSSAMSDALDENKREARHEDADVTYIELDARTSKTVDDTTITVPRKSLDNIADEDTGLILTTNHGTFTFDDRALAEIYDTCDKTNIDFYIEEEDDDQYIVLIKDGSDDVIDLGSGEVEIVFDYRLKSGEKSSDVNVYRIGDGDKEFDYARDMKADYSSSKKEATFTTDTLGTFLVTTDTLKTGSDSTTTTPPTTPSYSRFVDVPSSRWSATYINKLASLGIINGTGGGYFEPTLQVTREEFVKMLAGVAGANVSGYTSSRFPDVPMSRWSASYIAWAADRGITTGTDGGRFAPTMKITREEMATMIYRYVQISGKTLPAKNAPVTFADADQISSWAQTAVSVMQQAGIIDGNVTNGRYTFDPKVPASREECAKMLSILYDLL